MRKTIKNSIFLSYNNTMKIIISNTDETKNRFVASYLEINVLKKMQYTNE